MRTLARILINLAFLAGILAGIGAAVVSPAYQHASRDTRIAVPVLIAVAGFALACLVLAVIPAKKKPAPRPSFTYADPARRGR